jgi:hypothetical protein
MDRSDESAYGDGELEIGWRTGSGGGELDGRGDGEEDGVRSGGELDGRGEGELSDEDGVRRRGGELDGREDGVRGSDRSGGGDGSGIISGGSVGSNTESVLPQCCSIPTPPRPICPINSSASANQVPSPFTSSS